MILLHSMPSAVMALLVLFLRCMGATLLPTLLFGTKIPKLRLRKHSSSRSCVANHLLDFPWHPFSMFYACLETKSTKLEFCQPQRLG